MTFIYRFVRSIPYDHPVCFLDGHVKIFVSWMASLSRAPDQHQVPAQVLPSSRSRVAISSPCLSVWFPVPPSLSLSRSNELISALVSLCVRRQIHQVPAQVLLSTPSPWTSSVRRDLVRGSFDLVLAFGFAFAFSALSALVSLCVRRQIHQVPAQVLLSTPSPSTSSVRRDLVPVSAFAFARSWAPPDQAPAVDNSKATAATESPLARAMFSSSSHSLAIKPARN
jgi:hypothetical protein